MLRLFGTDGIRACENSPLFQYAGLYKILEACQHVLGTGDVLLGQDTRDSCAQINAHIRACCHQLNILCFELGVLPTAGLSYVLSKKQEVQWGIVVTASHNTHEDNGLKFFASNGTKLTISQLQSIETHYFSNTNAALMYEQASAPVRPVDWIHLYTRYLLDTASSIDLRGKKIAIDCANGSASYLASSLFKPTGAQIVVTANQPDGVNINRNCGSTYMNHLQKTMQEVDADLGFSFDGDADRLMLIGPSGKHWDGNDFLVAFAQPYLVDKKFGVVGSVMINGGVRSYFESKNVPYVESDVGDANVALELLKADYFLGAEPCGHVIQLNKGFQTGDGMFNALTLLKHWQNDPYFFNRIDGLYTKYEQVQCTVESAPSFNFQDTRVLDFLENQKQICRKHGCRLLVRPSGTQPVIRIFIEGNVALSFLQKKACCVRDFFKALTP